MGKKSNPPNLVTDKLEGLYWSVCYKPSQLPFVYCIWQSPQSGTKVTIITITTKYFAIKLRFVKNLFALKAFFWTEKVFCWTKVRKEFVYCYWFCNLLPLFSLWSFLTLPSRSCTPWMFSCTGLSVLSSRNPLFPRLPLHYSVWNPRCSMDAKFSIS